MISADLSNPCQELSPAQVARVLGRDIKTVRRLMKTSDEATDGEVYILSWVDTVSASGKEFKRTTVQYLKEFQSRRVAAKRQPTPKQRQIATKGRYPQRRIPKTLDECFN